MKIDLPRYEWDFSGLKDSEYEAAWQHECYRESLRFLREKGKLESWDPDLLKSLIENLDESADDYHYKFAPIMEHPWVLMREEHKKVLSNLYVNQAEKFAPAQKPWVCNDLPLDASLVCLSKSPYHLKQSDYASVSARLNYTATSDEATLCLFEIRHNMDSDTRNDIVDRFKEWLDSTFPDLPKAHKNKRPKSYLTNLIDLAVYRLVEATKKSKIRKQRIAEIIGKTYLRRAEIDSSKVKRAYDNALKLITKKANKQHLKIITEDNPPTPFGPEYLHNLIDFSSFKSIDLKDDVKSQ